MKLFQKLDLYKGVILASLLLLPGVGWWIKQTRDAIATANRAITEAIKPGGQLEEIGKLQKQLEAVENNRLNAAAQLEDVNVYFDSQIFRSAASGGIGKDTFQVLAPRTEGVMLGKQPATDHIVKINFDRAGKDTVFTRDLLFAVLFNCESGFRGAGTAVVASIWKLYSIKIANALVQKEATQQLAPPPELEDRWTVTNLQFARREPSSKR